MNSGRGAVLRRAALGWPAPLVAYTALAFAMFANVWSSPATRWIGIDGDPDSTIWAIAWSAFSLVHHVNPFVTSYIFFPTGTDVLWANADAPIALGWVAAPVTLVWGPIVAYNLLQTLCMSLSAWVAYLAIKRFVDHPAAALAGGLIYGFGPYMWGQAYGHMALTFGLAPPLILIVLDRLFVKRDISPLLAGAAVGVIESFQLLVSEEVVASSVIVAVLSMAWLAAWALLRRWSVPWAQLARRAAYSGAVAAAVFVMLSAYPLYLLFRGPSRVTHEPVRGFGTYVTDLYNLVIPPLTTHLIHNDWTVRLSSKFPGVPVESGGYLGVALVAVVVLTVLVWWRAPVVAFSAGALALVVLVSLGPHLMYGGHVSGRVVLPWELTKNVPILNEVLVERLSLYEDLLAGLLLAVFVDRMWRLGRAPARAAALVAAGASLAMVAPSLPWITSAAHVPPLFQPGTQANAYLHSIVPEGSVAVILPAGLTTPGQGYAVLWQATDGLHFKMPEGDLVHGDSQGYATSDPPPSPLWSAMSALQSGQAPPSSDSDLAEVRAQLRQIDARAVVVGEMGNHDAAVQYFDALLGVEPVDTGGVLVWPIGADAPP